MSSPELTAAKFLQRQFLIAEAAARGVPLKPAVDAASASPDAAAARLSQPMLVSDNKAKVRTGA